MRGDNKVALSNLRKWGAISRGLSAAGKGIAGGYIQELARGRGTATESLAIELDESAQKGDVDETIGEKYRGTLPEDEIRRQVLVAKSKVPEYARQIAEGQKAAERKKTRLESLSGKSLEEIMRGYTERERTTYQPVPTQPISGFEQEQIPRTSLPEQKRSPPISVSHPQFVPLGRPQFVPRTTTERREPTDI